MKYTNKVAKRHWPKRLVVLAVVLVLAAVFGILYARQAYFDGLKPVSEGNQIVKTITIERGATLDQIAKQLEDEGLIRSQWVFKMYVARKGASSALQAGTYNFSPSQSVDELVAQLSHGKVVTALVAIIPGQHLEQIRSTLINYGFKEADVDAAMNPALYQGNPALSEKPPAASLEGYIYPDSYHRDSSTTPQQIIKQALDEMGEKLTPDLKQGFAAQGLTTHQAIILASVVEREVSKPDDRAQVAQVFLKRLGSDIALESDATKIFFDSYKNPGLPPAPISNVSFSSLQSVANPAQTNWLYFVSGDDGTTHFSNTLEQHESNIIKYCTKLCGR